MAIKGTFNYGTNSEGVQEAFTRNDTVPLVGFIMNFNMGPIDLQGYQIKQRWRRGSKSGTPVRLSTIGDGITVTDAANGGFVTDKFNLTDWDPGVYYYDIEFTDISGDVFTWVEGTLIVEEDVT